MYGIINHTKANAVLTAIGHFSDYPADQWHWENFTPEEMACNGDGLLMIDGDSMDKLQALRELVGKPMIVNSAYRSPAYNAQVGGAVHSQHLDAKAYDIRMTGHDVHEFEDAARHVGFTGFGFYQRQKFMHIDTGPERSWGIPWPRVAMPKRRFYRK